MTQRNLKSAAVPVWLEELVLVGVFLGELEAELRRRASQIHCVSWFQLGGRAGLGGDDDGEVVGGEVASRR